MNRESHSLRSFCARIVFIFRTMGFWSRVVFLIPTSLLIVIAISSVIVSSYIIDAPNLDLPPVPILSYGAIWSSSENARYVLSALAQAQAAIFGIFFTLNFIIAQIQIQNKAASPELMRQFFESHRLFFVFFVYVTSIIGDLILLRYSAEGVKINLFWALSFAVFAVLLLIPYMAFNISTVFYRAIEQEIQDGQARHNLTGVNLSNGSFGGVDLDYRILKHADLKGADLGAANLMGANLEAANLMGANLEAAKLEGAKLKKAKLEKANLRCANLMEADLEAADLVEANLAEADLHKANLAEANLKDIEYNDTTLKYLLGARNLDKAILDDKLKKALDKHKASSLGPETKSGEGPEDIKDNNN